MNCLCRVTASHGQCNSDSDLEPKVCLKDLTLFYGDLLQLYLFLFNRSSQDSLEVMLTQVWKKYRQTTTATNQNDYLSLEHLALILKHLETKSKSNQGSHMQRQLKWKFSGEILIFELLY